MDVQSRCPFSYSFYNSLFFTSTPEVVMWHLHVNVSQEYKEPCWRQGELQRSTWRISPPTQGRPQWPQGASLWKWNGMQSLYTCEHLDTPQVPEGYKMVTDGQIWTVGLCKNNDASLCELGVSSWRGGVFKWTSLYLRSLSWVVLVHLYPSTDLRVFIRLHLLTDWWWQRNKWCNLRTFNLKGPDRME